MILDLDIQRASDAPGQPSDEDFRRWVQAALTGQRDQAELTIRTVDEAESQTLNRDYRGKDYPTNVLSFPADLPPEVIQAESLALLGDLVICTPVVAREAEVQRKALEAHWAHMVVHGMLHLLGYDHEAESEAEAMEALETAILGRLGYPDPYTEQD